MDTKILHRAYARVECKDVGGEQRIIMGIATTPTPDRVGDVIESSGIQVKAEIPLFLYHDSRLPVGSAKLGKPRADGTPFEASLPRVTEDGALKSRVDEAWQMVKYGIIRGVSIGFRALEDGYEVMKSGALRFTKIEIMELSLVPIPANMEATITAIKSVDQQRQAAPGRNAHAERQPSKPGVAGKPFHLKEPATMATKTTAEQISALEAKLNAHSQRVQEIQTKAADEGRTKSETESEEFDTLMDEVKTINKELSDLRALEKLLITKAQDVPVHQGVQRVIENAAPAPRENSHIISVSSNLPKGMPFVRYFRAMTINKGDPYRAMQWASMQNEWKSSSPQVEMVLKAAVAAGDTTTSGWASELVYNQNLASEFMDYLRPQTVIGRIPGLRQVPFNIRFGGITGASSANWVGEGMPAPVSKLTTTSGSLSMNKMVAIVALSKELIMSSTPSAEALVRQNLTETLVEYSDSQFLDPNQGGVSGTSPASVTYGVTPISPTGATDAFFRADFASLVAPFITARMSTNDCVLIMSETAALKLGLMRTDLGVRLYPEMNRNGGSILGFPVITSQAAYVSGSPDYGDMIIMLKPSEVQLADDGGIVVEASDQVSLQMLDNPTNQSTGSTAATTMVSMFQTESVAVKAARFINYQVRRSGAVQFIRTANYA